MSDLRLISIDSIDALRGWAAAWDNLWFRSDNYLPTARAETLAQWLERRAAGRPFHAVAVAEGNSLLAALPLVETRLRGLLGVGQLPIDAHTAGAGLLVDRTAHVEAVADCLASGLSRLPWPWLWLDSVPLNSSGWQAVIDAVHRGGLPTLATPDYDIGLVDVPDDWEAFEARLSGNFRRQMRKMQRRAEKEGGVDLLVYADLAPADVEHLVRRGFEIEDRGWKAAGGTSVVRTPGLLDHYIAEAQQLARWRQLYLVFLEHAGRPIAFEYGLRAKGVYMSLKVGYDEAFAALSPGQLLRWELLRKFHTDGDAERIDFSGPLVEATARWTTSDYPVGRLAVATHGGWPAWGLNLYARLRPGLRKLLRRPATEAAAPPASSADAPTSPQSCSTTAEEVC